MSNQIKSVELDLLILKDRVQGLNESIQACHGNNAEIARLV